MYLADCHNHTCCSADSRAPLELVLEQAARAGLSMVCTTDHMDLMTRTGQVMEDWDWAPVLDQHRRGLERCPRGVELRLGVELNTAHIFPERNRRLLDRVPLDMVVGSAHNLSLAAGGTDFCLLSFSGDEDSCHRALDNYFDSLLALSETEFVDVLAHMPYTLRYMNRRDGNRVTLERYYPRIRTILTKLIHRGAGLEVNTDRGTGLDDYRPILELYRQLGGQIITLGSDAHTPEHIGAGIPQAAELLRQVGFRYYTVYRRRRPEFIPL